MKKKIIMNIHKIFNFQNLLNPTICYINKAEFKIFRLEGGRVVGVQS